MATVTPEYVPREEDREFFQRELEEFVPDRVFDAHTHLWHPDHNVFSDRIPSLVDYETYVRLMEDIYPNRVAKGLFLPTFRDPKFIGAANQWTGEQTAKDPICRGHFFVTPEDDPEWVRQEVKRLKLHGLKCYHTLARHVDPTWEAEIPDYLPESIIRVANQESWTITLHMVKSRAAADPGNIHWIRHFCKTYPNMQLILAHSARGFQPAHNLEGLPHLKGLDNLWFDTSANCEPIAHQAIIRIIGHDKLLYGGDTPVTHERGRSVSVEDSFLWLEGDSPVWQENHQALKPVFTGLEHLRSLKWACWSERLSDTQVEDIFWNNAARLLGLK